jgi:hypothetical protein
LLKGKAERITQRRLAHLQHEPAHADTAAYVFVGWVNSLSHGSPPALYGEA